MTTDSYAELLCAEDLLNQPRPPRKVQVKREGLYLAQFCDTYPPPWSYAYFISWDRINNQRKLLFWIRHLADKTWCDRQLIKELMDAVDQRCHIHIHIQERGT